MTEKPPLEVTPPERLLQVMFGAILARCVSAIAELGVPDALAKGPLHSDRLARSVGANPDFLGRVMRTLVSAGVVDEPSPGTYAQTPLTDLLRGGHPQSMRDIVVTFSSRCSWEPLGRLSDAIRSGQSGAKHAFGVESWDWYQRSENKHEWDRYNAAMSSFSVATSMAVVGSYDFSPHSRIVDVGGGHGFLLRTVLSKLPSASGVLCDLPGVIAGADRGELGDRIECIGTDFFETVPAGGDCYLLKNVIHDWDDARCQQLLGNVARVMAPAGRVLVIDFVVPDERIPHPSYYLDITMMAQTPGGRERTAKEFADLLASAGLRLEKIHPTPSPVSVVEASKV